MFAHRPQGTTDNKLSLFGRSHFSDDLFLIFSAISSISSIRMGNLLYISNRVLSSVLLQLLQCTYLRFPKANPIFAYSSCQLVCEYLPIQNLKLGSRVYLTLSSTIVKFSLVTRTISARNLKESK